jgi:hypothetical protein
MIGILFSPVSILLILTIANVRRQGRVKLEVTKEEEN